MFVHQDGIERDGQSFGHVVEQVADLYDQLGGGPGLWVEEEQVGKRLLVLVELGPVAHGEGDGLVGLVVEGPAAEGLSIGQEGGLWGSGLCAALGHDESALATMETPPWSDRGESVQPTVGVPVFWVGGGLGLADGTDLGKGGHEPWALAERTEHVGHLGVDALGRQKGLSGVIELLEPLLGEQGPRVRRGLLGLPGVGELGLVSAALKHRGHELVDLAPRPGEQGV